MTEVVTSPAAIPQLNLLAKRQQVFSVDRTSQFDAAPSTDAAASQTPDTSSTVHRSAPQQGATAGHHQSDQEQTEQPRNPGPSRVRIEIRSLDLGLTPSEVVGTPDVLQRFDEDGDGRIGLLDSNKAILARQKDSTFVGLAAAPHAHPVLERPTIAADGSIVAKKVFVATGETPETGAPKKLYAEAAAEGGPATGVDVPKKFYGQGAEVVVGPAVAGGDASAKTSEKVAVKDQVVSEDGTGEVKLYDKVAQTDTDQSQGESPAKDDKGNLSDKAQQVVAAIHGNKKTVVVEVSAYTNAAAIISGAPAAAATTTVVTA